MSINLHVNMAISLAGLAGATAAFGVPMFVQEHTVTANRQDGPYSSVAAGEAAGFTVAAAPTIHAWITRAFAQKTAGLSASQVMIGRRLSAENLPTALSAIETDNPASWYATNIELNTPDELMALATWTESRNKIAIGQSSSAALLAGTPSTAQSDTATFAGTETDGTYSLIVTNNWTGAVVGQADVVRSTTPATHADLAVAMDAAWDAVSALAAIGTPTAGGDDVVIAFTGLGNGYTVTTVAPAPGTLAVVSTPGTQNPGELMNAGGFNNTALWYHDDDTEYMDAAITARALGFNLDAPGGAGIWAYLRSSGISATRLQDAQKTAILADKANYYSPVTFTSGVQEAGFHYAGTMASGRFIDLTTTSHWLQARMEEAILRTFLAAGASSRPKVPFDDPGIARMQAAAMGVMGIGVRANHFAQGATSSVTGRVTPYIDVPKANEVSTANKTARLLTMSGEAVLSGGIQSVGSPSTVGFTIDLVA
jgi:hypothetical protein